MSHINKISTRISRSQSPSIVTSTFVSGTIISMFMVVFFGVMKALGFGEFLYLRALNFIFLGAGIFLTIRLFARESSDHHVDYLKGMLVGFLTSVFAILPFSIFLLIYLNADASFVEYIQTNAPFGEYLTISTMAAVVSFEGLVSGIVFTYVILPYFKKE